MKRPFWKLSGAGNDFVLVHDAGPRAAAALARRLCDRRRSIGADGLLVVNNGSRPAVRYFNADGSRAFCGNGTRCAAWWLRSVRRTSGAFTLQTDGGPVPVRVVAPERVRIGMPLPSKLRWNLRLKAGGKTWLSHAVTVGVPHGVVEVRGLDRFPVFELGLELRRHPEFGKAGANIDFVERSGATLKLRTFERGVEDETLACGTGAVASAFWAHALMGAKSPVRLLTRGGDALLAGFSWDDGRLTEAWLEGPARITFQGEIDL